MVLGDLIIKILVVVFQGGDLVREQVDEIEETVVLILRFDECRDDLIHILDSTILLDLLECLLDYRGILDILVHQLFFLLVRLRDFANSFLHDLNWI